MYRDPQRNDTDRGKPKNLEKKYLDATLSTTNLTEIDPGANLDLHGERQVTNRLNHGTASLILIVCPACI
jgi:hypothetical protein